MNKTSSASIEAIQKAIKTLNDKGLKPTQRNVSTESGLSIRTVKTYWARVQGSVPDKTKRVQPSSNRVKEQGKRVNPLIKGEPKRVNLSTPFERLKRRNCHTEIIPYRPWLNHIK